MPQILNTNIKMWFIISHNINSLSGHKETNIMLNTSSYEVSRYLIKLKEE
jgi:hypothetical protein